MMWKSDVRFTPATYLKDRALFIAAAVAVLVFVAVVMGVLRASTSAMILLEVVVALVFLACFIFDYVRQAQFWRNLEELGRSLEHSAYVPEMLDEPSFLEGKIARDAALAIAEVSNREVTDLRSQTRANSEYIELWVHEAKTPLAAAKLVAKRVNGQDGITLRRELERMDDLIGQPLFAARTESLERDYLIREIDLLEVVREVCKSHMHYLTSLDVALDIRIDPTLTVFADRIWLEFIITQLVVNAAKYDARTITFTSFEMEDESSSACTILEVKDDGCGVPASDVPRVFDRGFTGEVGRAHGSATGMGLYLVARMCMSMGLGIMFASEEGVGSRVQLSFPHDRRRAQFILSERKISGERPVNLVPVTESPLPNDGTANLVPADETSVPNDGNRTS